MTLKVEVYGRNIDITDRINTYVDKKVAKLDRYLSEAEEARVDLAFVKSARSAGDRHVAQITVRGKGLILRSEERADDIFAAMDTAVDKMQRQMERFKGKHQRGRGDGKPASEVIPAIQEEEAPVGPIIARRKHFSLIPMDEYEALEQMQLLGHDNFFVFFNSANSKINILYHRRDGTYGLIDPEIG